MKILVEKQLYLKKVISQFLYLKLIEFEELDSAWINLFNTALEKFRRINSKPTFHMSIGNVKNEYILWIESSLSSLGFFNHKKNI